MHLRLSRLARPFAFLAAMGLNLIAIGQVAQSDVETYRQHVQTLANPFFEGRGSGSKGNDLAADYLEFYYRKAGLKPAFPSASAEGREPVPFSSYRQSFSVGRGTVVQSAAMSYVPTGGTAVGLKPGEDFNVLAISSSGEVKGQVVFAGYSINSGQQSYRTYAENDTLEGKIAMIMRFEPMDENGRSRLTEAGGPKWSNAAALRPKLQAALDRKAAAIILVNPPGADDERTNNLEDAVTSAGFGRPMGVPVVMMSIAAADALIRAADASSRSLLDLRKLSDENAGVVPLNGAEVSISAAVEEAPKRTQNLGGILPGRGDLAREYIVMGAHFDHVGYGRDGGANPANVGQIHPGADDNASGTSGILIAMQQLRKFYEEAPADQPLRSILFMHFSGEEIGLLGSKHFVQNSPFDAGDIYAMINFDMIGRLRDNKVDMNGTGTAVGFDEILDPLISQSGLSVNKLTGGQGPSDHQSFYNGGIPVIFFFTGFHDVYHAPGDIASLVNCEGAVQVVSLGVAIAQTLAARTGPLEFRETESTWGRAQRPSRLGEEERNNRQNAADAAPAPGPGMAQMKVRFGIRPAYGDSEGGVLAEGIVEGGSAAAAGLKAGDRLVKWNGEAIADIRAWMTLMSKHNPGDVVEVTVVRDGAEQNIKVMLKAADAGPR